MIRFGAHVLKLLRSKISVTYAGGRKNAGGGLSLLVGFLAFLNGLMRAEGASKEVFAVSDFTS